MSGPVFYNWGSWGKMCLFATHCYSLLLAIKSTKYIFDSRVSLIALKRPEQTEALSIQQHKTKTGEMINKTYHTKNCLPHLDFHCFALIWAPPNILKHSKNVGLSKHLQGTCSIADMATYLSAFVVMAAAACVFACRPLQHTVTLQLI